MVNNDLNFIEYRITDTPLRHPPIKDEVHFLINFKLYEPERQRLFLMRNEKKQNFKRLYDVEKCTSLMSNPDNQLIVWIGKFIYKCFQARSEFVLK